MQALRAALAAAVALAALVSPTAGALCSDPAFSDEYTSILANVNSCESATGVTLQPPLSKADAAEVCATCTALAATTKNKKFPSCNVKDSDGVLTTAQLFYETIFTCSTSSGSSAGSKDAGSTPTPTPTTKTPTPTPTTKTPGATPTPGTTNTTTPSPATTSSSGSGSTTPAPGVSTTTQPSTSKTKAPSTTTSTTGDGSGTDSTTSGSLGSSQELVQSDKNSVIVIVGIAGGVVVFVILVATLIVCRQRRRNRDGKLDEALLSTEAGTSLAPGQSRGNTTGNTTGNTGRYTNGVYSEGSGTGGGGRPSTAAQSQMPQGGLWEDEAIVAARIPREKVRTDALLSRGGYGEVYRGVYNDQVVAIKTLLPETRKNMKQINAFLAEVKLMASLEHDRIVFFIGVAWDSLTDLCVVSEYMEGGDLRNLLMHFEESRRAHGFDHDKVKIALHISHALTYLHSLQPVVLHRDLKSKNILLDKHLNAKLTDFGVSRERSDRTMTAGVGTSLWMAPEVMMGERYDEKSDIFSFGVVLSELDSHSLPYSQVKESESGRRIPDTAVLQMVSLGKLKVKFSPEADPAIVELANACVSVNAAERPTASEVLYKLHSLLKTY